MGFVAPRGYCDDADGHLSIFTCTPRFFISSRSLRDAGVSCFAGGVNSISSRDAVDVTEVPAQRFAGQETPWASRSHRLNEAIRFGRFVSQSH